MKSGVQRANLSTQQGYVSRAPLSPGHMAEPGAAHSSELGPETANYLLQATCCILTLLTSRNHLQKQKIIRSLNCRLSTGSRGNTGKVSLNLGIGPSYFQVQSLPRKQQVDLPGCRLQLIGCPRFWLPLESSCCLFFFFPRSGYQNASPLLSC